MFNRLEGISDEPSPGSSGSKKKKEPAADSVGKGGTNPPDLVAKVKERLAALTDEGTGRPFHDPADSSPDALIEAIEAYQRSIGFQNPDGKITVGKKTWQNLFPAEPGADPGGPTPTPTAPEADPERVIYCLLMHLASRPLENGLLKDVPWLSDLKLIPEPGDPEPPAQDDPKSIEEDAAEADHTMSGPVGKPHAEGEPAGDEPGDVEWVQKRLTRFGLFSGEIDGAFSDTLRAAIIEFQREHVEWYRKNPKAKVEGFVLPDMGTYEALKTPRHELFGSKSKVPKLDPVLKHRLAQRQPDGTARVVTNLGARVSAGDTLWWSGRAAGFEGDFRTADKEQVHWEIFSEHPLVVGWGELEDDDDDLRVDLPRWMYGVVELHELPTDFVRDEKFTPAEIADFYSEDRSNFLRTTRCRFRSEWGLDIPKLVEQLRERGWNTSGLAEQIRPYVWWDQVEDAVEHFPASPLVWHYNPIEFLGLYQTHLDALAPTPAVVLDPNLFATLVVRVYYDNRAPMEEAVVCVLAAGVIKASLKTDQSGTAVFSGLPVGPYESLVLESKHPMVPAPVLPNQINEIEFVTEHPGPELAKGHIQVIVRKHTKSVAKGTKVALLRPDDTLAAAGVTNGSGKVIFAELEPGHYSLAFGDADVESIQIVSGKNPTKKVYLPPPIGHVEIFVERAGARVPGISVAAMSGDGGFPTGAQTDEDGRALLELREGKYKVAAGNSDAAPVTVSSKKQKTVVLQLKPESPAGSPAEGG